MSAKAGPSGRPVATSIVIRAFNEEKYLSALFDALDAQTDRDFEVIVVDSGSFDRTREIAERRSARVIRIASQDFTFGYSLNVGIAAAAGRNIAIVSAHTQPCDDDWLANLVAPLDDDKVAAAYGRQVGVRNSRFAEVLDFDRMYGLQAREDRPEDCRINNANAAIRRNLWEARPFDETLPGLEDIAWAKHWMAEGYRIVYRPKAALYHIHEESWRQIRRRYYREAVTARWLGLQSRRQIPLLLAQEAGRAVADFGGALWTNGHPVAERLTAGQRLRETVYFRMNKTIGTVRGLLEDHAMETPESRERALFDRTGAAVVIHGPGKAALEDVEVPQLKPGDVLIRVSRVAVCATDLEILDGTLGYYQNGTASYPIVPGHEFSGRIAAIGQNVSDLAEQDPVVVECIQGCGACGECQVGNFIGCADRAELGVIGRNGAYAEYVVAPARFVHKLPPDLDLRAAALTEPLAVVLKGLRRLDASLAAKPGARRCAVIGAGPLGHICAKVLASRGHHVTAFDRNPKRRALFDGTDIAAAEDLDRLGDFGVVVEVTGDPEVLSKALHTSPANAVLLLLGLPYGRREFSFEAIAAYDKTVIGSVGSTAEDFEEAIKILPSLDLTPYFECAVPLSEFDRAWRASRAGEVLKVMLEPQ